MPQRPGPRFPVEVGSGVSSGMSDESLVIRCCGRFGEPIVVRTNYTGESMTHRLTDCQTHCTESWLGGTLIVGIVRFDATPERGYPLAAA